jgi:hypothetical protein
VAVGRGAGRGWGGEGWVGRTGAHMPCDMLRTSESCLANRTFVIPGHGELGVAVAVAKEKNRVQKRQKMEDLTVM